MAALLACHGVSAACPSCPPRLEWAVSENPSGTSDEVAYAVAFDASGNIVVGGTSVRSDLGQKADWQVVKYGPSGAQLWATDYDSPEKLDDVVRGVAVDPSGNILAAGFETSGTEGRNLMLRKYDPDGSLLWTRTWGGGVGNDMAYGVAVDGSSNIVVAGASAVSSQGLNWLVLKYDPTGELLWTYAYAPGTAARDDEALAVSVDAFSGSIFISGYEENGPAEKRWSFRKLAPDKTFIWGNVLTGSGGDFSGSRGVAVDRDGDMVVGGEVATTATNSNFRVQKWVEGGTSAEWDHLYNPFNLNDAVNSVSVNPDGDVFAVGRQTVAAGDSEWLVRMLGYSPGPTVSACWTYSCSGAVAGSRNAAFGSVVDGDGNLVVVGGEEVAGQGSDWKVRMFSMKCLSGSLSLTRTFGGTGRDFIVCLTLTNTGAATVYGAGMTATWFDVSGAGGLQFTDGPFPAMPVTLARDASVTFTWTLTGVDPGLATISCTLTASGRTSINAPSSSPSYTVLVPAQLGASMNTIPASVCNGSDFLVTLTVTNTGEIRADSVQPAEVLESPAGKVLNKSGPFPATPVSLVGGGSITFTWTFQGTSVGTVAFMTTVTGTDSETAGSLSNIVPFSPGFVVTGPGDLAAYGATAPFVSVGQQFMVTLTVTNTGASTVSSIVPKVAVSPLGGPVLLVGSGATPTSGSLAPGDNLTFTWTFQGATAVPVTFTMTAEGTTCGGGTSVKKSSLAWTTVQTAAGLKAAVAMLPAKVNIGQQFLVTVTVTNTGQAGVAGLSLADPVAVGGGTASMTGPNPPVPYSLLPGSSSMVFTWTMTGVNPGSVRWGTTATGNDANSGSALSVGSGWSPVGGAIQVPASLSARAVAYTSPLCLNSQTVVTLTITNSGEAAADLVSVPDFQACVGGAVNKVTGVPLLLTVSGLSSTTYTWTYRGTGTGLVDLTTTVTGIDHNTGLPVADVQAVTNSVTVVTEGDLAATGAAPQRVSTLQVFPVSITVTNTGGAPVNAVTPRIAVGPGASQVLVQSSPSALPVLAPNSSTTFTWTFLATTAAPTTVCFTMTAEGTTCGGGVSAEASDRVFPLVENRADLSSIVRMIPGTVSTGQPFLLTVTVTNTGDARANGVTAQEPKSWGAGTATAVSGPYPASVQLNGGTWVTFTWTMTADTAGAVRWSCTVQGIDANSGTTAYNGSVWSAPGNSVQVPAALSAATVAYIAPLCTGANTLVTMTVSNTGGASATWVTASPFVVSGGTGLSVVSGPTPSFPQTIPGGGRLTFTWTCQGGTTGATDLSTTVTGNDGNGNWAVAGAKTATPPVTIVSPGALSSSGSVRPLASTGQLFRVSFTVTNTGGASVTLSPPTMVAGSGGTVATFQSGPVAVPSVVGGGSATTFVWTYLGAAPGVAAFTMSVQGTTCSNGTVLGTQAGASATVETAAGLATQVTMYPGTVTVGQQFMVTATLTNTGQASASGVTAGPPTAWSGGNASVSAGPFPAMPVPLTGGASVTFTWTLTASVGGAVRWCTTATGADVNSGATLFTGPVSSPAGTTILTPAALAASVVRTPSTLCSGRDFLVTLTVTNTGQTQADGVTAAALLVGGTGSANMQSGPNPPMPVILPGGSSQTFSYTFTGASLGTVQFMTTVTGSDANLGSGVARITGFTPTADVTSPGVLTAAASVPDRMSTNQVFLVTLTVTNAGGTVITGVTPSLEVGPGAALVSFQAPPASSPTINPGATATYSWTYKALSGGLVSFTASATGQTCAGGSTLQAAATASSTISLEARLYASVKMMRTNANIGQSFMVTVTVTNTGQAAANGMDIATPFVCTGGGATLASGPNPALPVTLAGTTARTFTWTFTGAVAGPVEFTATANGTDAYAGTPVTSGPVSDSRPHLVEVPAAISAALALSTTSAVTAEKFLVMLTVTNSGGAVARVDRPVLRGNGGGGYTVTALPGAFPRSIPGGTTVVFTWTATPGMEGPIQFSTTAWGVDANELTTLSAPAAQQAPFTVIGIPVLQLSSFTASRESLPPGESLVLRLSVKSVGTTSATMVVPSTPAISGDGTMTLVAGPAPASVTLLAPGATATFTWEYRAAGVGTARISGGADAANTAPVSAGPLTVFIARPGGAPRDVVVDPNPFRTGSGGTASFRNIPAFALVRLYTISGEPVTDVTADIFGVATWNGRNRDGTVVGPGVYLLAVESPGKARYVGKILVVR